MIIILGKASYEIFIIQMVVFGSDFIDNSIENELISISVRWCVCICGGLIWYYYRNQKLKNIYYE